MRPFSQFIIKPMVDPRSQFGPVAASYLTSAVHADQAALQHLIDVAQPNGGAVVDVATGAGHTAYAFAPFVDQVVATDITEAMLKVTRETAAERGIQNFDVCFAEAENLPFRSGALAGLTCRMGAHHFRSVPRFIEEAHRALAPGGWFLVVDTIGSEDDEADELVDQMERLRDGSHQRNVKGSRWRALAQKAGFGVERYEERNLELELEDWMDRMRAPSANREQIRSMVGSAGEGFANYLAVEKREGQTYINLREMLLLARK
jgi:SAM-dependent methyltransferase